MTDTAPRKMGRPTIPEPMGKVYVRLSIEDVKLLDWLAEDLGLNRSSVVRMLVRVEGRRRRAVQEAGKR